MDVVVMPPRPCSSCGDVEYHKADCLMEAQKRADVEQNIKFYEREIERMTVRIARLRDVYPISKEIPE